MRRVRFSVAMSVDGFIADRDGGSDWIVLDPEIDFGALMDSFDTVLMGRRTFEAAKRRGGLMPGKEVYVFSTTLRQADCPTAIVSSSAAETLAAIKGTTGKDIWLFGGASLFGSLLGDGLVDTVEIAVIPVLLGDGVPLLPVGAERVPLRLTSHRVYAGTGLVSLEYEPA